MATHVKALAVLYLVLSGFFVLAALLLMVVVGGAVTAVGTAAASEDAAIALPIIGVTGMTLAVFLLVLALPGLLTGWGLLTFRPWARILGIVLSAINLLNVPIGTALGLYGLWVLLSKETEALFSSTPRIPPPTI
jgi:hypothetical protein